ncbi:hypothetical protein H5410_043095 [Solanum commersonii]|uniref:Uncharacterized protein n=1 Tax=Solanum commersonii TaxID=4109 RepID=A0A9J5XXH6_SOLCO|nr:hypothetical protein H5410_043095 [Solanum commersonii]
MLVRLLGHMIEKCKFNNNNIPSKIPLGGVWGRPTSTPPALYGRPFLRRLARPPLHMSKPSQSRFPQLVHQRSHSHLLLDNLIPNLIAPSVPTHPSQHPHLRNMHSLNMCVLDWPTLRSIQQDRLGGIFLSHKTPKASLHFLQATPMRCVTSSSMSPLLWITDPRYLKLSFLGMIYVASLTSTSVSSDTSLNLHPKYSVLVLLNLNPLDSNYLRHLCLMEVSSTNTLPSSSLIYFTWSKSGFAFVSLYSFLSPPLSLSSTYKRSKVAVLAFVTVILASVFVVL